MIIFQLVKNLLIARLEFRTEESPDVQDFVFSKSITPVVLALDVKLQKIKEDFVSKVLELYTRPLVRQNLITGNCGNLSKGRIFMLMKEFQQKCKNGR